jgi:hypothetical protein
MKKSLCFATILIAVSASAAKDHPDYQTGKILQMNSVKCGVQEKDDKSVAGEILGTDDQHKKTQELLCQEYTLQADSVVYKIRPKDDKHPVLLPIGETAHFRMHKDKLVLQVPEADGKEREYIVVSMTPRPAVTSQATNSN